MESDESSNNGSLITLLDFNEDENNSEVSLIEMQENEEERKNEKNEVKLRNMQRVIRNWRKCLGCNEKKNLHRPSFEMRSFFCKSHKIYIEKNDRVCDFHFQRENWIEIQIKKTSTFTGKAVDEMLSLLLKPDPENERMHFDIGLNDQHFKQILAELNVSNNPQKKHIKMIKALRLYFERLHVGHTYEQIARRHDMNRKTVGILIKLARTILIDGFVPQHLGHQNLTRQYLIDHTTDLAFKLFCNNDRTKCVTIWDATYIYTCSSKNYAHQRKIYSGQKRRHLFKIMKVTTVDGCILDVFGPFKATINDAEITKIIFEKTAIMNIYNAGDVILVDRGFRDCVAFLKTKKFDVKIPEFIQRGNNGQLTTKQCNQSRLITKMRYAIEVANGRIKNKWALFNKMIPSILNKNLMPDYKIASALMNVFGKAIICDKDDFQNIGTKMLSQLNRKNELQKKIRSNGFKQIALNFFQCIDPEQLEFPRLSQEQIKLFSLGTYAMKQSISYAAEHRREHGGKFEVFALRSDHVYAHFAEICAENNFKKPMLICAKIKSRFRGSKIHKVYILYDAAELTQINSFYIYSCQHGLRTLGCCSHVMAVVWFFSLGRHERSNDPASHHNDFFNIFT